ncbi:uncharacterized protein B0H18DRAFT_1123761 [Fomitopsis serialis]|uniref:uncharacterized protein n=1 Tax=Fomitopsis serialis TaxID=139415 RepID=UPI0020071E65|nr:uncharacterized protein B0H18DRAFT_1123761 [Neoantrodia serialis]KAH9917167.1 hypothetical protein B0H18DRAFT_1123761 [Neoantrodia serialis]
MREKELLGVDNPSGGERPEKVFVALGRAYRRLISLYDEPRGLVNEYDKRLDADELTDSDDERSTASRQGASDSEQSADRLYRGYKALRDRIPESIKYLDRADVSPTDINVMFKALKLNGDKARSDDTSTLKTRVIFMLSTLYPDSESAKRLLQDPRSKHIRGLQNNTTAELLCPVDWDWNDEPTRRKIKNREPPFHISSADYPRFLFDLGNIDHDDLEKSLFRGLLLLMAYKCVFTSPSSATEGLEDEDEDANAENDGLLSAGPLQKRRRTAYSRWQPPPRTRSSVAEILNMKEVTGRSIAYICVQVHFALNDIGSWSRDIVNFDYEAFYNNIVDYFEHPPGPRAEERVKELLNWWTEAIFGKVRASSDTSRSTGGSVARIATQRLAKETM